MQAFYAQVFMDDVEDGRLRFYAECPLCGKRYPGRLLPWFCRGTDLPSRLSQGTAGPVRQRIYNRCRADQVQKLAVFFNYCRSCGAWVCDDCYRSQLEDGICVRCQEQLMRRNHNGTVQQTE